MQALASLTPSYLVFAASVSSLPTGTARTSFSLREGVAEGSRNITHPRALPPSYLVFAALVLGR